jgi:release factor glutamine methyltransferase
MSANSLLPTPAISSWLKDAAAQLAAIGIDSARLDAELILSHTLRKPRTYLHAHYDEMLSERATEVANARLRLRLDRVPIAYIVGHKEFYGRTFKVTTATLIPRPESEAMIDLLKTLMPATASLLDEPALNVVDVGTGSGCLGITAKLELPQLSVTLLDISRHALTVAEQNARAHDADVALLRSDLLAQYPLQPDIILANLPYVDPEWDSSPETMHEPAEALFAGDHGLALIKRLVEQASLRLTANGTLLLEADRSQLDTIRRFAKQHGFKETKRDGFIVALQRIST